MHLKDYPFKNLPFSDLFQTYVSNFDKIAEFYATNPFDNDALEHKASDFTFAGNREKTVQVLKAFNQQFSVEQASLKNIERLKNKDALTIVTGQQLGIYGGPVFTFYKTITAIHLARSLEEKLNRPVIPVFWLADEDHDYDEVRSLSVLNGEGVESFSLPALKKNPPPVSELELPSGMDDFKAELRSTLIDTDFSANLWKLLDDYFTVGKTFRNAFGSFISRLFSKHGLVLAGSHNAGIKNHTKNVLKTAVESADTIRKDLEKQSEKVGEQFHRQVTLYDSHLFYLDSKKGREKIARDGKKWVAGPGKEWSREELLKEIENNPERFSPDVFLRPVIQDRLLPTLGYVAGPGEVAYYAQMKPFYQCFNQQMPVIYPRLSGTFIEPAIVRIFNELPFEINEYNSRIEDLETAFVERTEQLDIESTFEKWKAEAEKTSAPFKEKIASVDQTLEGATEKVQATLFNELDKLKGKTYRAIKRREKTQMDRIRRLQQNLFPERNLQERTLAGIYFMNKFGVDIWDRLLDEIDKGESLNMHKLVYL